MLVFFFFQAEDGIRDAQESRGLGDVYKRQVQYPSLTRSAVRHVELVSLGAGRLLLVVIVDTGRVEQRVLDIPDGLEEDAVGRLRSALNGAVMGLSLIHISEPTRPLSSSYAVLCL